MVFYEPPSPSRSPPRLQAKQYAAQLTAHNMILEDTLDACSNCCKLDVDVVKTKTALNRTASFIRAHDLDITDEDLSKCTDKLTLDDCSNSQQNDGILRKSTSTSSSSTTNNNRDIVSLNGSGVGSIMSSLVIIGLKEATDESNRWNATSATDKVLKKRSKLKKSGGSSSVSSDIIISPSWQNPACGKDVFVWSSKCTRKGHGSDYPVVKSRGLIPATAKEVVDLIIDSSRVMEYNKTSIGREDEHILTQDLKSSIHSLDYKCSKINVSGEAKIMCSKSQVPLTRKTLEFKTLFYARQLSSDDGIGIDDGVAYITVGRSVWESPDGTSDGDTSSTRCEILLSVNLIREVKSKNGEAWCELTCINHGISPGIPMFIGKQVALTAAENYIKDIRAVFEKK